MTQVKIIVYSIIAISAGTWQFFIQYIGLSNFFEQLSISKQFIFSIIIIYGIMSLLVPIVKIIAKVFFPSLVYSKNNPVTLNK